MHGTWLPPLEENDYSSFLFIPVFTIGLPLGNVMALLRARGKGSSSELLTLPFRNRNDKIGNQKKGIIFPNFPTMHLDLIGWIIKSQGSSFPLF